MIKKIILPLVAIVLLSACGNKFSLQKRKYTKGFYFANSKTNTAKTNDSEVANTKAKKLESKPISLKNETVAEKQIIEQPIVLLENNYANTALKTKNKNITITASAAKTIVNIAAAKQFKALNVKQNVNKLSTTKKESGGNTNIILLVILSIFPILALVAMYLHDGNKVTLNFWIDLLLHLTFIGYIIFALLVVFDIVNLA